MGLLVATVPLGGLFEAALTVRDSARLAGSADVSGFDAIPSAWLGTFCSVLGDDAAGLLMGDTLAYELQGSAELGGAPALEQLADTTAFFDFGDVSFAELAAMADAQIADGTAISNQVGPTTNADGSCRTSDQFNWGDPENPGAPCGNWFPVIYAAGDLAIESQIYGQGILLVEGDLRVQGGASFYGPVVVKGALHAAGNFTFYGGVRAAETSPGTGSAAMYYSGCALERALSRTRLAKPRALTERPWFQRR